LYKYTTKHAVPYSLLGTQSYKYSTSIDPMLVSSTVHKTPHTNIKHLDNNNEESYHSCSMHVSVSVPYIYIIELGWIL